MIKLYSLLILFVSLSVMAKSDHFDGKKYFNPGGPGVKSFWTVLKWKITSSDDVPWPDNLPIKNYPLRPLAPNEKVNATFINHASFLIQLQGLNVITDPIYSKRASPFSFAGPKRAKPPGIAFEQLPKIDVVIISHNHYDHFDLDTMKNLDAKYHPLFLVPMGDKKLLKEEGIQNVQEMDWWEEVMVKDIKITFTPAQHWSARGLFDKNESLWGSFMISNKATKVYFAGDTGYSNHFVDIMRRLGAPDLALLPIGAYKPRWFMKDHHMNPKEAVKAHIDLGANRSLAMHFGSFKLSDEGINEPVLDLKKSLKEMNISSESFMVLDEGQALSY